MESVIYNNFLIFLYSTLKMFSGILIIGIIKLYTTQFCFMEGQIYVSRVKNYGNYDTPIKQLSSGNTFIIRPAATRVSQGPLLRVALVTLWLLGGGISLTGTVEQHALDFQECFRPGVVPDIHRHQALGVVGGPADEERHHYGHWKRRKTHRE